jgi:hypothetical protein
VTLTLTAFPSEAWRIFQSIYLVDELLQPFPDLRHLQAWPDISDWQARADQLDLWSALPRRLEFQLQKPLGQRAKRKQKNRVSYEVSIFEQGRIPTRAQNVHDFFNALIWLSYPQSKWSLHRQAYDSQQTQPSAPGSRSELCDRLTCFDEGGIIFRLPPGVDGTEMRRLIRGRDQDAKKRVCREHRGSFHIFGHGILEVLFAGSESLFASCAVIDHDAASLDEALAAYLQDAQDQGGIDVHWLLPT